MCLFESRCAADVDICGCCALVCMASPDNNDLLQCCFPAEHTC